MTVARMAHAFDNYFIRLIKGINFKGVIFVLRWRFIVTVKLEGRQCSGVWLWSHTFGACSHSIVFTRNRDKLTGVIIYYGYYIVYGLKFYSRFWLILYQSKMLVVEYTNTRSYFYCIIYCQYDIMIKSPFSIIVLQIVLQSYRYQKLRKKKFK